MVCGEEYDGAPRPRVRWLHRKTTSTQPSLAAQRPLVTAMTFPRKRRSESFPPPHA
jgi:hypothetical protein